MKKFLLTASPVNLSNLSKTDNFPIPNFIVTKYDLYDNKAGLKSQSYFVKTYSFSLYLHSLESISSFDERRDGYFSAMKHFHLELPQDDIYYVHYSEEESYQDIYRIFKDSPVHSTAFICDDDTIAAGALRAFHMLGYKIPEDISLIGFNDRPNASLTRPSLTTINVPKGAFGTAAVDSIINLISKKQNNNCWTSSLKTRIGTQLVIRDSVKKI
nr:substrate-binding domain-containing protein [Blautia luti]